jgi:class 3 adenylate cyclase/tetratricopeptide (TPR) repeat protein
VWLSELGLDQYAEVFEENAIDLEALGLLTDDDLKELEVNALGHRKKLLAAISRLNQDQAPVSTPPATTTAKASVTPTRPSEGERREVTVLFADISGFTRLSSEMDAEEVSIMLNSYFKLVDDVVRSFGGAIDKHIGDAVMAVFGAPTAHSNDPERAVRAAVEIHNTVKDIQPPITVHIGIASGQVVASDIGSESHQEYTITGDTVNLASRLQDMAKSRQTFLSNAVHHSLAGMLDCEEVGDVAVKGLSEPVKVWRLDGIHAERETTSGRPFVGRKREIRQFKGAIEDCLETEHGQTVYVRGEAGIGKSRLTEEFESLATEAGFICCRTGKGQDAIRVLIRKLLDIPSNNTKKDRATAAAKAIDVGLIADEDLVYLNDLLNLPQPTELHAVYDAMDNVNRNRGKQKTMAGLIERLSAERPVMICVEDIHWADSVVLAHIGSIAEMVSNCPSLLLLTGRMEGDPIERNWRNLAAHAPLFTMDINPLRNEEALILAQGYFEASNRFARNCIERAGGNPMFLEQLLRSAEETSDDSVPGSVQSIVLSRVDNLDPLAKQALQAASVIGQHFSLDLLRHLIGSAQYTCSELIEHKLVRPQDGDYQFAHALIRDGVYASLLNSTKKELHQNAANWFADRDITLHAQHLDRAESPEAAGAYAEAALSHAQSFHFEKALELVGRGKELATTPSARYRISMLEGECLRESGKPAESINVYNGALLATEDPVERCRAWIGLAAGMRVTDQYDEAFDALEKAEKVASAVGMDKELSEIHYYRGSIFFPLANLEGGLSEHQKALEAAERAGLREHEARALSGLADANYSLGRITTALDYFRRTIELSREHGFGRIAVGNAYMVPWIMIYLMEMKPAREDALAAIESAAHVGHQRAEMVARLTAARVLIELGKYDDAEEHANLGLKLVEQLGAKRFEPFLMIQKTKARFHRNGHQQNIVEMIENALTVSRETGIGFLGPWVLGTLALVHQHEAASLSALAEGEKLLAGDCVGHNYHDFYRDAMEVSLRLQRWDDVERYAKSLQDYAKADPLPWSTFAVERARALARFGNGMNDAGTMDELQRLQKIASTASMATAIQAIDAALSG